MTAYWSLPDNEYANVTAFEDYAGARICRPDGWSTFDLTMEGLIEPVVTYVFPPNPSDCIQQVIDGKVDMVSLDIDTALGAIASMPEAKGLVQPNPNLSKLEPLNLAFYKFSKRGAEYAELFNAGLNEMRESGE